jgi:hypothetical protein
MVPTSILKSCTAKATITPKVMTLTDMKTDQNQYIGCLIKVQNAEFDAKVLCSILHQMVTLLIEQINDATQPINYSTELLEIVVLLLLLIRNYLQER